MNPYVYTDPPFGSDFSASPTRLKIKSWPPRAPSKYGKHASKRFYLTFLIGVSLGFIITNIVRDKLIGPSECLIKKNDKEPSIHSAVIKADEKFENFVNSQKNLIYVGVMTANKYLDTRAKAVYETWGKDLPGKIGFFSSQLSETKEDLPLIKLKGVDDSYPPQKKSFMMLKYMYDNYLNDYEFFMRADDDVYIRTDRLEKFLKSLNSSKLYYIGQAGKGNPDEFGHLNLKHQENFCMGGPGMIFSKSTLEKMAPHVKSCLKNLKSLHEDVEVGRCVQKYAGIPCTWSYEMQNIFYHNNSDAKAFTGSLKQKEVHRAITLHPIKNHVHLHRLHAYIESLMIKEKESEIVQAVRDIHKFCKEFQLPLSTLDEIKGGVFFNQLGVEASLQKWIPKNVASVLEWDFFHKNSYNLKDENPKHRMSQFFKESTDDVIRDIMETINRLSKERGRVIDFKEVLYGYHRNHPSHSSDYVIDMLLLYKKYRGRKMTVPVRRHAYIQVPFGPLHIRESQKTILDKKQHTSSFTDIFSNVFQKSLRDIISLQNTIAEIAHESSAIKPKKINFILPLAGRFSTFQRFMDDFKRVCLLRNENVRLIVVSFRSKVGDQDSRSRIEKLVLDLRLEFPFLPVDIVKSSEIFARALALELGAAQCQPDDLLFFVDVDITFTSEALNRIRWHTIQGKQVYFPIVFSEFDPAVLNQRRTHTHDQTDHFQINEKLGYWRVFGFGIVSVYNSDLKKIGGLDISIKGWGKEDVEFFEKVLRTKDVAIIRSPDPGLIHVFHSVDCDPNLHPKQLVMCQGSLFNTYASTHILSKDIIAKPEILMFKHTN